tara:strand:+ start:3136 stop:3798 length:663 start_codon:yes stop_codon:yes gene_type:complete
MLQRWKKNLFYNLASPLMRLNSIKYKYLNTIKKNNYVKIHLGPGKKNYIPGWINIDANMFSAKCDMWLDLRYKLPFQNSSVNYCYSHHMIEHLPNMKKHLEDIFRILKSGGVYRIGGPNGDSAIKKFIENDANWFSSFPDNRESIGGRFENFIFCRQEHLTILTFSFLNEILKKIGFTNIIKLLPAKETSNPDIFNDCLKFENENDFKVPHTLIIECQKP